LVAPFGGRMPAILRPADEARWLDPRVRDPGAVLLLLSPYPVEAMTLRLASRLVNSPFNDGPELLDPTRAPDPHAGSRHDADGSDGSTRVYRWWGQSRYGWQESQNRPGTVTVEVIESGRGSYVPDNRILAAAGDPGAQDAIDGWQVLSSLIVPLRAGARAIGT